MCDPTPIRNWLFGVLAAIVVAISLIIAASVANLSFWLAWMSPYWMGAAAAVTFLAAYLCAQALDALDVFCKCAGSKCDRECSSMRATLIAAAAVLGIQGSACISAAFHAWIPISGLALMWIILGALVIQLALIGSAINFFSALEKCNKPLPPTGSGSGPLGGIPTKETSLDV